MVNPVNDEVDLVAAPELGRPVEKQAVEPVLGKGPDQDSADEKADRGEGREAAIDAEPDQQRDDRPVNQQGHDRVDPGEEIEQPVLEEVGEAASLGAFPDDPIACGMVA